jgi:hypothetical protein
VITQKRITSSDVKAIAREFLERARAMENGPTGAVPDDEFEKLVQEEVDLLVSQLRGVGAHIAD